MIYQKTTCKQKRICYRYPSFQYLKVPLFVQSMTFKTHMGVSCEIEAKKSSCEFFRKSLFEPKFLPAGMYTPWSILV